MSNSQGKAWYKSKTLWAAVIYVVVSGVESISQALGSPIVIPMFIKDSLLALGLYGVRDAVGKPTKLTG